MELIACNQLSRFKEHMAFPVVVRRWSLSLSLIDGRTSSQGSRSRTRSPTTACDPGAHGFPWPPSRAWPLRCRHFAASGNCSGVSSQRSSGPRVVGRHRAA